MANINYEADITDEMYQIVAEAVLYKEDTVGALRASKLIPKGYTQSDVNAIIRYIIQSDKFQQIKDDLIKTEEATLIDENQNTIMLMYNRLLRNAQSEGKYDVVARILKEIRQLKAIENEQMQFEVIFKIQEPKKD